MWEKTYDLATYDDAAEHIVTTPDCGFAVFTDSAKLPGTPVSLTVATALPDCAK